MNLVVYNRPLARVMLVFARSKCGGMESHMNMRAKKNGMVFRWVSLLLIMVLCFPIVSCKKKDSGADIIDANATPIPHVALQPDMPDMPDMQFSVQTDLL